jgi:hypothetical protein
VRAFPNAYILLASIRNAGLGADANLDRSAPIVIGTPTAGIHLWAFF